MNFNEIKNGLERELNTPPARNSFENSKKTIWQLSAFDKPEDVVDLFLEQNRESNEVKADVLRSILRQYQTTSDRLWSTLLILSFMPKLVCSCKYLEEMSELDPEELTMLVVENLLESAASYPVFFRQIPTSGIECPGP